MPITITLDTDHKAQVTEREDGWYYWLCIPFAEEHGPVPTRRIAAGHARIMSVSHEEQLASDNELKATNIIAKHAPVMHTLTCDLDEGCFCSDAHLTESVQATRRLFRILDHEGYGYTLYEDGTLHWSFGSLVIHVEIGQVSR